MAVRVRVTNKTKGTSSLLPPNTTNYTANLGDGTYSFEPVLSVSEEFTVVGVDPAPVNLTLPGAVGEATEDKIVAGVPGVWDGASSLSAQWMDGSTPLGPAGYDLAVLRAMGGKSPFLREAATNAKGTTYADSLPIGPITTAPQFTTQPALAGTPTAGQPMTATVGAADGFPAPQVTGRIERQLGTSGEVSTVEGGMSSVFVSGYRYRPAAAASNSVQTVEAFGSWTAVVAATVAPLAAGANLPKQTIIQNTGTTVIAADSLFTGKVDTYALVAQPSGFTINATTGAISVNTASLALRTDETITVRASNDTPATLDRTFTLEVVNQSGTATVPGGVSLGTVTVATGPEPGSASITNVKLPPNGGSPLTNMRLRVSNVNYDYPATLGTHVVRGLPAGARTGIILGVNAIGPSSVWSSPINFTVAAPLQPPVAFGYEVTPSPMIQGKMGLLKLNAQGKTPMTYSITVDGQNYTNTTGEFDGTSFTAGAKTFTGTISNGDAPNLPIEGGFTVAPYVAPTVSLSLNPASPSVGGSVTVGVTATAGADLQVEYSLNGGTAIPLVAPYIIPDIEAGTYTITANVEDDYEGGTATVSFIAATGMFQDDFDGSGFLADAAGWSMASGVKAAFVRLNGSIKHDSAQGSAYALSPDVGSNKQKISGSFTRLSSTLMITGVVACFASVDDHIRVGVETNGTVVVRSVKGGTASANIATYTGFITGTANVSARNFIFETDGTRFRVSKDGAYLAPSTGTETLPATHTGTRAGIFAFAAGGHFRDNFINFYRTEVGSYWSVINTTPPTLVAIPQVGQRGTYTKGVYENADQVVTAQIQRSNGGAYANVKAVVPGLMDAFVVGDVGYTFRIAETAPDGTVTYSEPTAAVQSVASSGPAITHDPANIYAISTPGTGSMRVRPYGATSGGTITTGTGTLAGVFPGPGAYSVSVDTGGGYGTAADVFAVKVGDGGAFYGLNASYAAVSKGMADAPVILVPVAGKSVILQEPLPKVDKSAEGFVRNGVVKNPSAGSGYGPQSWDNRRVVGKPAYVTKWTDGWSEANIEKQWPQTLAVGDTISKYLSFETSALVLADQSTRSGSGSGHIGVAVMSAPPTATQMAPPLFKASNMPTGYINLPGYNALRDKILAMNYATPGTVPNAAAMAAVLGKVTRFNPTFANLRGGTYWNNAPEQHTPYKSGWPQGEGNYYLFESQSLVYVGMMTNLFTNAQKIEALDALIRYGIDSDRPGSLPTIGAGINQSHEFPVMLSRIARNMPFTDLIDQPGNNLSAYFIWTQAMLPMVEKHDRMDWPMFSRRRKVVEILPAVSGKVQFKVEYKQAQSGWGDRDRKQAFRELELVRESTGEVRPFDPSSEDTTRDLLPAEKFGILGSYATPLQVGEYIYMRIPAAKKPFAGLADWLYSPGTLREHGSWSPYNPTPLMSYRDRNRPAAGVMLLHALGVYPKQAPGFKELREYLIRTNIPDGTPNNGWVSSYPAPYIGGYVSMTPFWTQHASALGLDTSDL